MPRKRATGVGRGGVRAPDGRAPKVGGPAKFSTRTDLSRPAGTQPTAVPSGLDLTQGAVKQMTEAQRAMPLPRAGTPTIAKPAIPIPKGGYEQALKAPTALPDEHVTTGADTFAQADQADVDTLREWVPFLEHVAARPGAAAELADLAARARAWFTP